MDTSASFLYSDDIDDDDYDDVVDIINALHWTITIYMSTLLGFDRSELLFVRATQLTVTSVIISRKWRRFRDLRGSHDTKYDSDDVRGDARAGRCNVLGPRARSVPDMIQIRTQFNTISDTRCEIFFGAIRALLGVRRRTLCSECMAPVDLIRPTDMNHAVSNAHAEQANYIYNKAYVCCRRPIFITRSH